MLAEALKAPAVRWVAAAMVEVVMARESVMAVEAAQEREVARAWSAIGAVGANGALSRRSVECCERSLAPLWSARLLRMAQGAVEASNEAVQQCHWRTRS